MLNPERMARLLEEQGLPCPGRSFATEDGVSWLLDRSVRTLRNWRAERRGPPAAFIGRWLYDLDELAKWLAEQTHRQQPAELGNKRQIAENSDIDGAASSQHDQAHG